MHLAVKNKILDISTLDLVDIFYTCPLIYHLWYHSPSPSCSQTVRQLEEVGKEIYLNLACVILQISKRIFVSTKQKCSSSGDYSMTRIPNIPLLWFCDAPASAQRTQSRFQAKKCDTIDLNPSSTSQNNHRNQFWLLICLICSLLKIFAELMKIES